MNARTRLLPIDESRRSTIHIALICAVLAAVVGLLTVKLGSVQHEIKALLIVVAGIAVVVAALRPPVGLLILMTLMPFEFHFSGTGSNEVLIGAIAVVLVWRIRASVVPAWVLIGGGSLVLGSFLATLGAQNQSNALEGAWRWVGAVILLFAAIGILRDRPDASRRMIDVFTGSAVVVVVFAFVQKEGLTLLVGAPYLAGLPNSFLGYYTVYAGYVAMAVTLATGEVVIALGERRVARGAIYGVALVFLLTGLAISTSRGGLVALAAGWLVLLLLNVRRGAVLVRALLVFLVVLAAALLATPGATLVRIEDRLAVKSSVDNSDKTRFSLQQVGEQALAQSPLGIGYGNFSFYLRSHAHSSNIQLAFDHSHETPVQIGLDAGWLGLAGFLMLWAYPIGLVLVRENQGPPTVRASAFAAALGGLMAQGLFDYLFYEIDVLIFFVAMVWGTIHALSVDEARGRVPTRPQPEFRASRLAVPTR